MTRFACAPGLLCRALPGGGLFVASELTGDHLSLNLTGRLLLEAIARREALQAVMEDLSHRFGVPLTRASEDVRRLAAELERLGFIVVEPKENPHVPCP